MPSMDHHQLEQLALSVASLRSGKYSDFAIRCSDNTVIHVHRAIICPRSQVFSAAVDGVFKEAVTQEIFLEEDEPLIVALMIDFLYYLDYNDRREEDTEESALMVNTKVYIMDSTSFTESARLIFENTPESDLLLRDVILQTASDHAKALFDRGEFVALLQTHGHFTTEVLRGVLFKQPNELVEEPDGWGSFGTSKKSKKKYRE